MILIILGVILLVTAIAMNKEREDLRKLAVGLVFGRLMGSQMAQAKQSAL